MLSCSKNKIEQLQKKENPLLTKAYQYYDNEKPDSAFVYFDKAKEIALKQRDSLIANICLIQMSIIASDKGDHFGAQEFALKALSHLNKKDTAQNSIVQSCLHELGFISSNLKEYDQAIAFFEESLSYSKNDNDAISTKNSLANAYRDKKDYQKSMKIQQEMLKRKMNKVEYARILSNLTYTKWLNNPNYNAQGDFMKALSIRLEENDSRGLNASFSHLTDYYEKKQPDSALLFAEKMYRNAINNKSPNDQLDGLQKLVKLSPLHETKKYFLRYQQLNDSILTARNKAKNQFALIRYETEKHKEDNLILQKDNTEKKYQIIKREILLYSALLLSISGAIIGFIWYRKRKQRLELEAQNTIRENQLRTSKKVHDVVANGLYRVMTEIENQENINKEHLLDKIEDMYEKSRDISYDQPKPVSTDFNEKISELLSTFISTNRTVKVIGNTSGLWNKLSAGTFYEVEHILQELMVNMDKHSKANQVTLQFKPGNNQIVIEYTDNGIGLQKDALYGNGLKNTETRIKNISGTITFEPNTEKGLRIKLSFPIS